MIYFQILAKKLIKRNKLKMQNQKQFFEKKMVLIYLTACNYRQNNR